MKVTIPYSPRDLQQHFHDNKKRWNFLLCHRRFGKSVMVINQIIKDAMICKEDRPRFAYIAPTYKQAKTIIWDYLKHYAHAIPGTKFNESELRADFPNGGRITLYGADNPDSLRGIYLDGVVLDEYAQISSNMFSEILRPALADRKGYAIFIGTPKGKNHFYDLYDKIKNDEGWYVAIHKASDTGYVSADELIEARKGMTDDEYMQEFECSWEAALKGAYYKDELAEARQQNRMCKVPYDPTIKVDTFWDIGWSDDTAICFVQTFGKEVRIIDTFSAQGLTLADYAKVLREKGYNYGTHWFPWDARVRRMSDGKSTIDTALEHGIDVKITPNLSVLEGINRARLMFPNVYFDEDKCQDLLKCLAAYRREYDDKKQVFKQNPLHDWSSHFADSFRYVAIGQESYKEDSEDNYLQQYGNYVNANFEFDF